MHARGARNWRAKSSSAARESVRLVFRVFFVCACLFALWCVRHQRPLKKSPPPPPPGLQRAAPARRDGDRLDQHTTHQHLCTAAVKHCDPAQACLRPRVPFRPRDDGDVAFQQLAVPLRWHGTSRPLGRWAGAAYSSLQLYTRVLVPPIAGEQSCTEC